MKSALPSALLSVASLMMIAAAPQSAPPTGPVKAGVDAWSRGDYKKAVEDWRGPANAGDADAQFNLAQAYKLGRGVPTDLNQAEAWYRKAALQGHIQAEDNYGLTLFQNGKRTDAVQWLQKSAERGEPRAQLVYGTMLFNGDGVPKDWVKAYALMTRSSAQGLSQGSQTLAKMDQYIPEAQRRQGIELAHQYEAKAQRPALPREIANAGAKPTIQATPIPPSAYASTSGNHRPGASYPPPGTRVPAPTTPPPPPPPPARSIPSPVHSAPPAVHAPPPPAANGRWRVQLGAFRDDGNARGLWESLKPRVGALGALQPYLVRAGAVTKLQAGPLGSSADAARTCAAVKARGNPCLPVKP